MIQKILGDEYLKRVDNMAGAEKEEYLGRVGEWLQRQAPLLARKMAEPSAVYQNAVQCSAGWNDAECRAWTEGARLLTALYGKADTWLPDMLYTKAAKRAIRQMISVVRSANTGNAAASTPEPKNGRRLTITGKQKQRIVDRYVRKLQDKAKEDPAAGTVMATQAVGGDIPKGSVTQSAGGQPCVVLPNIRHIGDSSVKPVPVRPKHIDQYVHLLPERTQKKAATVQGLLRELDMARENARLLMNDPDAKDDSRAQWAKAATMLDGKVKAIYRELDAGWEKLVQSGRVVVDDLGNARVVGDANAVAVCKEAEGAEKQDEAIQRQELTPEDKAQVKSLRSWLRDTRGPKEAGEKHDAYVARWKERYLEMVGIGGDETVTEAVVKAAELYGIVLEDIRGSHN